MEKRIIHIGADSAGYELKESLMAHLLKGVLSLSYIR